MKVNVAVKLHVKLLTLFAIGAVSITGNLRDCGIVFLSRKAECGKTNLTALQRIPGLAGVSIVSMIHNPLAMAVKASGCPRSYKGAC